MEYRIVKVEAGELVYTDWRPYDWLAILERVKMLIYLYKDFSVEFRK